jgi:uncharacterized membrane protein YdjX (TVP38/TMEM64 family)
MLHSGGRKLSTCGLSDKAIRRSSEEKKGRKSVSRLSIPASGRKNALKASAAAAAIILLVIATRRFDLHLLLREALAAISGLGPAGPVLFVALYILATVLLLPGSILTLGAGAVFGVVKGSIAVSIGATLGATCAFLVGRYLARDWVAKRISGNPKFESIDDAVAREGWKIVVLTRLSPIFPFNLLNYAFGLTRVGIRHYFFASWLGMIPGTVMYVYIGSLAGDLAGLGAGGDARTAGEWILYGVGLLATIGVTVFVTRLARRALAERIHTGERKND